MQNKLGKLCLTADSGNTRNHLFEAVDEFLFGPVYLSAYTFMHKGAQAYWPIQEALLEVLDG